MENCNEKNINSFALRTIALISMIFLNVAWSGIISSLWLQLILGIIGSGSITLFVFLLEEGYKNTSNLTKYMVRLLVLGIISAAPYYLVYGDYDMPLYAPQNLFSSPLTLFFCLGTISLYDKLNGRQMKMFAVAFFCMISFIFRFEWCPYALILMFIIHIYREDIRFRDFYIVMFFFAFAVVSGVMYLIGIFGTNLEIIKNISLVGCIWPVFLIRRYNGQHGKRVKFMAYSIYPLMLISLYLIKVCMSR